MIELEIDGKKVEIDEGSMIMHAADKAGVYIPHFCYHKKLSIAANCRMCLVEVENARKPMPACATPVTSGMVVQTCSEGVKKAQQSVMEFLLINHPLDCPICDQGGECQLQDLAVGYGAGASRYTEAKRVVPYKEAGPLISMREMARCIHCTRCVRFGQEIAGDMELGMINRGEHAEVTPIKGDTVDSELSGNMIDICPVGALTSKPFRYSARTWELSRRKSIAAHDSSGANLTVQVKDGKVMRVLPLENREVNDCWIADRERFSYEALNSEHRLRSPMIKQGGKWSEVTWQTALEYIVHGLTNIRRDHGAQRIGALVSPSATVEEMALLQQLLHGLGSENVDYRLRHAQYHAQGKGVQWLGMEITALSKLDAALVVGSNLRKDHPLFALRVREAVNSNGAKITSIFSRTDDWAMPLAQQITTPASEWVKELAAICAAVAEQQEIDAPVSVSYQDTHRAIAGQLLAGDRAAVLLGNAVAHHASAADLQTLANWLAQVCSASVGYLTEAANTVGAQVLGLGQSGLTAQQMLTQKMGALFLLHTEPGLDTAHSASADAEMVVTMSPFKCNLQCSDVLLPVAPFTETSGTFVNAQGLAQSFYGVVRPLGETRPGWKVLRVLGDLLGLKGMAFDNSRDVRNHFLRDSVGAFGGTGSNRLDSAWVHPQLLDNGTNTDATAVDIASAGEVAHEPVSAAMYEIDGVVRRAYSLQATRDARERSGGTDYRRLVENCPQAAALSSSEPVSGAAPVLAKQQEAIHD